MTNEKKNAESFVGYYFASKQMQYLKKHVNENKFE